MVKSGTDFRDLTLLTIEVPPKGSAVTREEAKEAAAAAEANEGLDDVKGSVSDGIAVASGRATIKWQHIQITRDIPDDEETAKVRVMGSRDFDERRDGELRREGEDTVRGWGYRGGGGGGEGGEGGREDIGVRGEDGGGGGDRQRGRKVVNVCGRVCVCVCVRWVNGGNTGGAEEVAPLMLVAT